MIPTATTATTTTRITAVAASQQQKFSLYVYSLSVGDKTTMTISYKRNNKNK